MLKKRLKKASRFSEALHYNTITQKMLKGLQNSALLELDPEVFRHWYFKSEKNFLHVGNIYSWFQVDPVCYIRPTPLKTATETGCVCWMCLQDTKVWIEDIGFFKF